MGTRLLQIITFLNVAPAATVPQPHGINIAGTQYRPDFVAGDQTDFSIVVTDTTVTVTNNGAVPANINVWLELKHTTPRELGGGIQNLTPQPFYVLPGVGSAAPAITVTSQWTAIVDPVLGNDATGTFGNLALAFQTIQAALDAIPTPVDATTARTAWTILVSPGTYDEDLAVDLTHGKKVILASWGPWNLGLFNTVNWQPSNERSITITTSDAVTFDSINPAFAIQPMLPAGGGEGTEQAQTAVPRISGQIDLTGVFAGTPHIDLTVEAAVHGVAVSTTSINAGTTNVRLYAHRAKFFRVIQGSNLAVTTADQSYFSGLLNIRNCGRMTGCSLIGGATVTSSCGPFYSCLLAGVYTGAGGPTAFTFDYVTDHAFKTYGASFAAGGVRVLIETANPFALPEQWAVQNVPANQAGVVMSAQVSTNFDEIRMMRPGYLVGIAARVTEAITAGTLLVEATINGVIVGGSALTVTNPPGQTLAAIGAVPYAAGDLIGMKYTTSVGFLPITADVEAWLEAVEEIPS